MVSGRPKTNLSKDFYTGLYIVYGPKNKAIVCLDNKDAMTSSNLPTVHTGDKVSVIVYNLLHRL